jgi:hypothetical protein
MNMELIKSVVDNRQALNQSGVIGISMWSDEVHIASNVLIQEEGLTLQFIGGDLYPYEISKEVDGIRLFSRCNAEEVSQNPQLKEQIKAELQKQLDYLEEDVVLDGMSDSHVS